MTAILAEGIREGDGRKDGEDQGNRVLIYGSIPYRVVV